MAKDYIPTDEGDLLTWLSNYQIKLTTIYNTLFGLTAGEITAIQNDVIAMTYMINQVGLAKTNMQDRYAYKDLIKKGPIGATGAAYPGAFTPPAVPVVLVLPGIIPRVRLMSKRVKAHPAYTISIGEEIGIVPPFNPLPPNPKPVGSAVPLGSSLVQIKFVKKSYTGVRLETKRGTETDWTSMGNYVRSPIIDSRPPLVPGQPEKRQYRMQYLEGNTVIGISSDVYSISTNP